MADEVDKLELMDENHLFETVRPEIHTRSIGEKIVKMLLPISQNKVTEMPVPSQNTNDQMLLPYLSKNLAY